jgi:diguanylate cyclase (GGDEF)-like protein/PAS domain S-box-containing protein
MLSSMPSLEALPGAALLVDADGRVLAANAGAGRLLRRDPLTVSGMTMGELVGLEPWSFSGDEAVRVGMHRANGVPFSVDITLGPEGDERVMMLREIAGAQLVREARSVLDLAFDHTPICAALFNTEGEYIRVNDNLCRLLGRTADELIGHRDQEFTHIDDRAGDVDAAWRILRGELDQWQTEKRFVRPDGTVVWAIANMTFLRDEAERPICWVGQFQDITERRSMEERLRQMADDDALTGLPNRRFLDRELELAVQRGRGALLLIDLDGFKAVNDSLGHAAGDDVLTRVAVRLRARLRRTDLLARHGGDEFAVILPEATPDTAARIADDLAEAVSEVEVATLNDRLRISASVGTALIDGLDSPAEVLALADTAMYDRKRRAAA